MSVVATIAFNVYRESVRDRVLYNLVFFALLVIGASYLIGQLTAGQDIKIIKDLGLAAISVFGLFIAVFIGIGLVSKEVERRSVYALLAKPVRREQLVLGKYAGLVLTLLVNVGIMVAVWYAVLGYMSWVETPQWKATWAAPAADPRMLKAVALIFVELMIVTAAALFFSTFSSPMVSAALAFGIYVIGQLSPDFKNLGPVLKSPVVGAIAEALYYLLPNLAAFDVKAEVVHAHPVSTAYLLTTILYGLGYVAALLVGAMFIFSRRDFK
ncbi:MAG TPA: ABC transporter permease [Vicinamibacterales bacterium]|nr:ABC transporter permease [Vicinamibacterales bacterium]